MLVIDLKQKLDKMISANPSLQYIDVRFSDNTELAGLSLESDPTSGIEKPSLYLVEEEDDGV